MQQVRETREDHKRDLAVEILRSGGSLRLQAWGTSMLPSIWPGDVLIIENRKKEIHTGDIVLLARANRFFIHRVVRDRVGQQKNQWITRGDCVPSDDPPLVRNDILGTVAAIQRGGHTVVPARNLSQIGRIAAWTLCHSDFFRGLALRLHAFRRVGMPGDISLANASAGAQQP